MNSHLIEPAGRCFQVPLLMYLWITGCVQWDLNLVAKWVQLHRG
jgi:hypothetical protein